MVKNKKKRNNCNNVNQYFSSLPHPPSGRIFLVHSFISVQKIDSYEKKTKNNKAQQSLKDLIHIFFAFGHLLAGQNLITWPVFAVRYEILNPVGFQLLCVKRSCIISEMIEHEALPFSSLPNDLS